MKRVSPGLVIAVALLVAMLMVSKELHVAEAVCNPAELAPCLPAVTSTATPSKLCCDKLRDQRPCLCRYLRDPMYRGFVTAEGAKKISRGCNLPSPMC